MAAIATLVCVLPHGENPGFSATGYDGSDEVYPYADNFAETHRLYGAGVVALMCALIVGTTTRVQSPPPGGDPAAPVPLAYRGSTTWACGVVSVLLLLLQIAGTYLVYSSRAGTPGETRVGLWLTHALVCVAALPRSCRKPKQV